MSTIRAIYENGVFRPIGPVELPERCEVEVTPKSMALDALPSQHQEGIWEILNRRYNSGHSDTAERHNEHQP